MALVSISMSGENWCKKLNHAIDDFAVHVLCFTPCAKGCANCPECTYKETRRMTIDCSKMQTAIACLKAECDFAEAADGQFICHKPKDALHGRATIIRFIKNEVKE